MKFYSLSTQFEFGKYHQKTLQEVLIIDKSYVEWCLINLVDFCFDNSLVIDMIFENNNLLISEEARNALNKKLMQPQNPIPNPLENDDFSEDEIDDSDDDYGSSGEKYGWYNGFSDDVIDDAFEGDPSNTWNVD